MERAESSKQKLWEGRDDAGNPGPVYGQKDQAPTQGYKKPSKATGKEEISYAGTDDNTGQTKHPGRQVNKQRKHLGK